MASLSTVSDNSTALSKIIDEIAYSILTAVLSEYSADVAKLLQPFPSIEQDTDRPLNEHCEERLFDQLKALDTLSVPSAATVQLANRIAVSLSGDDLSCVILHLHTQVVESDGSKKRRSLFNPGRPGNSNFCRSPKMSFVNAGTSVKTTSKSRTLLPRPSAPTHTDDKVTLMLTLCLPSLDRKVGGRNKTGWKWKSVTTYPKIESRASVGVIYSARVTWRTGNLSFPMLGGSRLTQM